MTQKIKPLITCVYWERVFLHIELEGAFEKKIFLRGNNNFISLRQRKTEQGENTSEIILNMSTVVNRTFMENSSWQIGYFNTLEQPQALNDEMLYPNQPKRIKTPPKMMSKHNEFFMVPRSDEDRNDSMEFCTVADSVAENLKNLDRVFRYGGTEYAYTVDFSVFSIDEASIHLCINSFFMKANEKWDKGHYGNGVANSRGRIEKYILSVKKHSMNALYLLLSSISTRKQKNILIISEVTTTLQGNLLSVYNRMKERDFDKEFNIEVSCRAATGERISNWSWVRLVQRTAKAGIIIVDNYVPILTYLKLDKRTKIIQVWHAGAGFKSVGYMRFGKEGSPFPAESVHKKYALAVAPSESLVRVFEEVFGIEEDAFLACGMPRMDGYLEQSRIDLFKEEFYKNHPELKGKKIILFAPTYRGVGQRTAYYDYSKIDFDQLYKFCGNEYAVLVKMHPFIKDVKGHSNTFCKPELSHFAPRILDFSNHQSINDLFYITDILITDYSSAYYEFSVFKRPIVFYVYDRLYYENVRGVYQTIKDSAPGKVCDSFQELMETLEKNDYELEKTVEFSTVHFSREQRDATDKLLDTLFCHSSDLVEAESRE